jgi:hypothetical protein
LIPTTVTKYYKWLSLATLLVSIIGTVVLFDKESIGEKLWIGFLVNLQFHMVFQFLSRAPVGIYEHTKKQNPKHKKLAKMIWVFFSWAAVVGSVVGLFGFLNSAIDNHQQLVAFMIFPGMFLGGYASVLKINASALEQDSK